MKKTVIAVCVFGLAAVAAQAQGQTNQDKRVTGYLQRANCQAAREHARQQQQAAQKTKVKAKENTPKKKGNAQSKVSVKSSAPVTPKAQQKQTLSGPFEKMNEHTWRHFIRAH